MLKAGQTLPQTLSPAGCSTKLIVPAGVDTTEVLYPGAVEIVTQHDGSVLRLRKLPDDYDPTDRIEAMSHLQTHQARGEIPFLHAVATNTAIGLYEQLGFRHRRDALFAAARVPEAQPGQAG